jgi:hypothetical protein
VRGRSTDELGKKYLVNQLELDCCEAQDQGYEFHFSLAPDPHHVCCLEDAGRCDLPGY